MFKSYYVVWKRVYIFFDFHPRPRLNRTMQYGNCHIMTGERCESAWFKSYYVVWKLVRNEVRNEGICERLNRTMQYGNKMKDIG